MIGELTKQETVAAFRKASREYLEVVHSFTQEQINIQPSEGSWSVAEVTEHLHKSNKGIHKLISTSSRPAGRDPGEMIGQMERDLLDFSVRLNAPQIVLPPPMDYDKKTLLEAFSETTDKIIFTVENHDLSLIPEGFSFPRYGELTSLELLCFMVFHTRRHLRQVKNIKEKLSQ